jgi:2'-hydroxyisoflavone reductase
MKLLVIGGTRLIGRHLVAAANARGHAVTLFNRGQHQELAEPAVETIRGDRNRDLALLKDRHWDAVIDTCGYVPRSVHASATALANSVDRYVFISSASVYSDVSVPGVNESGPVATLSDELVQEANDADASGQVSAITYGASYGGLKVLCERTIEEVMPGRALVLRPGLVVGSGDYTDRFTYWVARVARGGEVLAPGRPGRHVQFIDAADLARWTVLMVERAAVGVYNANGVPNRLTMAGLLDECKTVGKSDASLTWVPEEFLLEHHVAPWSEMPLWIPESEPSLRGFMYLDCSKAFAAGLVTRPVGDTIADVLRWHEGEGDRKLVAGLDAGKERDLLREWNRTR